jgi:hypothetical protein
MTKEMAKAIVDATVHGIKEERLRVVNLIRYTANNDGHENHYPEDCWCHDWLNVVRLILGESSE